jgi:predicted dehydrogenase
MALKSGRGLPQSKTLARLTKCRCCSELVREKKFMKLNRRKFIYGATAGVAGVLSAKSWSQVARANSDIRVAVVGFNGRGGDHISGFKKINGVRLAALCDADQQVLGKEMNKPGGESLTPFTDIRRLLENKDIDVVSIATPNHWHALAAIWAVQAGKDVYVEKPVSHNVWEGRKIVEAARKYGKIVQTGTQSRSQPATQEAVKYIQGGKLGKVKIVRGLCYKRRDSIGKVSGPQQIPPHINYDLWCGPAPIEPLMRKNLHYDWHWVWNNGNGDLGNQGIHQMDIARWIHGADELSPAVFSIGGRLGYIDDGQTPNTMIVYHAYKDVPLIFEVRGLPKSSEENKVMDTFKGANVGNVVHCEGGNVVFTGNYSKVSVQDKDGAEIKKFEGGANHYENFIKAVRSRKHSDLNADILEGHLSSALCHTGNISYRLGAKRSPDEIKEEIKRNNAAEEALDRMLEHLAANGVNLKETPLTMGEFLKMNPKKETFVRNDAANEMLTRRYREPYVVPEKV